MRRVALTKRLVTKGGMQGYIIQIRGEIPSPSSAEAKKAIFKIMEKMVNNIPGAQFLKVSQPRHSPKKKETK